MVQVQLPLDGTAYLLFKSDIVNFVWKKQRKGGRMQIFIIVFSSFLSVKYFLKIWANHFGCVYSAGEKFTFKVNPDVIVLVKLKFYR